MLQIQSDQVTLCLDPWMGGGILSFAWRGIDICRPFPGSGNTLDLASFPLVPFCNRIAGGYLVHEGKKWMLPSAPFGIEPLHALHGIGWQSPWSTLEANESFARLGLKHDGTLWPWAFSAEQCFEASPRGFTYSMSVINHETKPMPTGLGLHPYFPRAGARLELGVHAQWETGEDRLPTRRRELAKAPNWFTGEGFDHCFERDAKPVTIAWPTHRLTIHPSSNLPFVHVYTPPGEDFFCVEPVSHIPDAINSSLKGAETGLARLAPGEEMRIKCRFEVEAIG